MILKGSNTNLINNISINFQSFFESENYNDNRLNALITNQYA